MYIDLISLCIRQVDFGIECRTENSTKNVSPEGSWIWKVVCLIVAESHFQKTMNSGDVDIRLVVDKANLKQMTE